MVTFTVNGLKYEVDSTGNVWAATNEGDEYFGEVFEVAQSHREYGRWPSYVWMDAGLSDDLTGGESGRLPEKRIAFIRAIKKAIQGPRSGGNRL